MFDVLRNTGLKYQDRRKIANKYMDQMAAIKIDEYEKETTSSRK